MKILIFIFAALMISGCLPGNRKKRKAARKIERARQLAPELFSNDTVFVFDTVVIERHRIDTTTTVVFHDSVTVVNNERVVLKYFYDTLRHEIIHDIECKEIIKPIETRFITEKVRNLNFFERYSGAWIPIFIGILLVIILLFLRR